MNCQPKWLDLRDALAIHKQQIQRYGGTHGIRDPSLLVSALARPQNLFAYGAPSMADTLDATEAEATRIMLELASGECSEEQFARWLEQNSRLERV